MPRYTIIVEGSHLAVQSGSYKAYVYRCMLHQDTARAKAIPSRYTISQDESIVNLVCPWIPILISNWDGDKSKISKGKLDSKERSDIRVHAEREKKWEHLRYQDWQLYVYLGDDDLSSDHTISGVWEKVPLGIPEIEPDPSGGVKILTAVGPGGPPPNVGP